MPPPPTPLTLLRAPSVGNDANTDSTPTPGKAAIFPGELNALRRQSTAMAQQLTYTATQLNTAQGQKTALAHRPTATQAKLGEVLRLLGWSSTRREGRNSVLRSPASITTYLAPRAMGMMGGVSALT